MRTRAPHPGEREPEPAAPSDGSPPASLLQRSAARHLWPHFATLGDERAPVFVRGEGCYLWDETGRRHLDALSSLFCVNAGHGRAALADAAAAQARTLAYATTWDSAHPRAIELAERIASLAPGDLDRVFFTSGGSESVESALKLVRAYHRARGEPTRVKVIARELAYHGTTLGALSVTGLPSVRTAFEPLPPGACHVPHTDLYRPAPGRDPLWAADAIAERIAFEGEETVAAVILEPVQNSGGCLPPPPGYFQRVREICDRHGVLLISDDTICGWGRLGTWFGAQRFDLVPDLITTAKGLTSAYVPMGAVIASERVAAPFLAPGAQFAHGLTFGGHPVAAAVALANLDVLEGEDLLGRVRRHEPALRARLEALRALPLVGDVRGAGYFWGIELVADQATRRRFEPAAAHALCTDLLAPELRRRGLICRATDRGYPVIQLAPPLIAGPEQFEEIGAVLHAVLTLACERMGMV
jgi:adenosylmethionine-8-amino-7-oxononanoate aminotransferase